MPLKVSEAGAVIELQKTKGLHVPDGTGPAADGNGLSVKGRLIGKNLRDSGSFHGGSTPFYQSKSTFSISLFPDFASIPCSLWHENIPMASRAGTAPLFQVLAALSIFSLYDSLLYMAAQPRGAEALCFRPVTVPPSAESSPPFSYDFSI